MVRNGKFGCFRCVLHLFWMRYDLYIQIYQYSKFHHFWLFFWKFENLMVQISTRSSSGWVLGDFWTEHGHNCSPVILCTVEFIFRGYPQLFPKIIFSWILTLLLHDPKSYSRGVLTDLKVLPSKRMSSQDYFTYLCYGHIFNISKDRSYFVKKCTLLVCYI